MTVRPTAPPGVSLLDAETEDLPYAALSAELKEIYDRAPFGIALFDPSGRYAKVNAFLAVLNRTPIEDHVGRTPAEVAPETAMAIMKAVADVARTGEKRAISLAPQRERYWAAEFYPVFDGQKTISGVGAIIRDLTAIVHAERVLRDHAEFERLVSTVSARLAGTPAHEVDREIESALNEVARFLRIEHGTLLKIGPRDLEWRGIGSARTHRRIPLAHIGWFMEAMRKGRFLSAASAATEIPARAEGEREIVSAAGVKSFAAFPLIVDGNLIGAAMFMTFERERQWEPEIVERLLLLSQVLANVLDRRRAEEELRRQRDELLHLWRIGTVNQLTATIAHDVRQPLTAIVANAAAASRFLALPATPLDEVREALAEIQRDGQRAGEVVARARELLGRSEPRNVTIDLPRLLEETVQLAHPSSSALGAELELQVAGPIPQISGDPAQIQQVLLNLISNASESVAGAAGPPRQVRVLCTAEDGRAVVAVADTGTGISEGAFERLFEPFFTTKDRGLGLGLPLCQAIVERHGGKIAAENRRPRGAVFRFTLPPGEDS